MLSLTKAFDPATSSLVGATTVTLYTYRVTSLHVRPVLPSLHTDSVVVNARVLMVQPPSISLNGILDNLLCSVELYSTHSLAVKTIAATATIAANTSKHWYSLRHKCLAVIGLSRSTATVVAQHPLGLGRLFFRHKVSCRPVPSKNRCLEPGGISQDRCTNCKLVVYCKYYVV